MPTRTDLLTLAERVTNIEMRLDDMDAKLDQILKQTTPVAQDKAHTPPKSKKTAANT